MKEKPNDREWVADAIKTAIDYLSTPGITSDWFVDKDSPAKDRLFRVEGTSFQSPALVIRFSQRHASAVYTDSFAVVGDDYDVEIIAHSIVRGKSKLLYKTGPIGRRVGHKLVGRDLGELFALIRQECGDELWGSFMALFLLKTGFAPYN